MTTLGHASDDQRDCEIKYLLPIIAPTYQPICFILSRLDTCRSIPMSITINRAVVDSSIGTLWLDPIHFHQQLGIGGILKLLSNMKDLRTLARSISVACLFLQG